MYLIDKGANLEARTMNEATPIMRAIESSKPEVVQYLIDKGAKVQVENKKGKCEEAQLLIICINLFSFYESQIKIHALKFNTKC